MKVALVSDCYLPRLGGIEVAVHSLAGALAARGHEVVVVTATRADGAVETADAPGAVEAGAQGSAERGTERGADDGPVRVVRLPPPVGRLPVNPLATRSVRALLAEVDVVHAQLGVVSPFAVDAVRSALAVGVPVAATFHSLVGPAAARALSVSGRVGRWAKAGVALSAVSSAAAVPVGRLAGGAPVALLPNAVDTALWRPVDPDPRPGAGELAAHPERPVRVVTATRLAGRKRPVALVEIVAQALEQLPPGQAAEVEVYGEGRERSAVEHMVARHGLTDRVRLCGRVARGRLPEIYSNADLFVSSVEMEAFGIAALEARSCGLPVLGREGTGLRDFVVPGESGHLEGSDEELATRLAELVTDHAARDRIRQHNRNTPVSQTISALSEAAMREYDRAVKES